MKRVEWDPSMTYRIAVAICVQWGKVAQTKITGVNGCYRGEVDEAGWSKRMEMEVGCG